MIRSCIVVHLKQRAPSRHFFEYNKLQINDLTSNQVVGSSHRGELCEPTDARSAPRRGDERSEESISPGAPILAKKLVTDRWEIICGQSHLGNLLISFLVRIFDLAEL